MKKKKKKKRSLGFGASGFGFGVGKDWGLELGAWGAWSLGLGV